MPFDPNFPLGGQPLDPDAMRAQLAELKGLIDAQEAVNVTQAAQIIAQAAEIAAQETRIAALEAALAGTALNPTVGTFNLLLSDPTTRDQVQAILDFTNSLSTSLTRV